MEQQQDRVAAGRAADPWYDQREEIRAVEFDAVDYFVHQPGRPPAPRPRLGVYLDSGLSQPGLAEALPGLLDDLAAPAADHRAADAARTGRVRAARAGPGGPTVGRDDAAEAGRGAGHGGGHRAHRLGGQRGRRGVLPSVAGRAAAAAGRRRRAVADPQSRPVAGRGHRRGRRAAAGAGDRLGRTAGAAHRRAHLRPGGSPPLPWDAWYNADHRTTAPLTRDHVRGYFWANLLTEGQLARLGGRAALRERAAEHGLLVAESGAAVVLRGPGPVTAFDDRQLAAAKAVLGPVLIDKPYLIYEGYPLRIVPDPGTAFRRTPADRPRPRLLA
ncbi:hypothetical protein GXW82_17965 [Streptacidiphilus sp. 4-A2]|nr:hypothetical protein [Streptacidiphilus sp. 4-A2]